MQQDTGRHDGMALAGEPWHQPYDIVEAATELYGRNDKVSCPESCMICTRHDYTEAFQQPPVSLKR